MTAGNPYKESAAAAETYAEAIFQLAAAESAVGDVLAELRAANELLAGQPEYVHWLAGPLASDDERSRLVEQAFRGRVSDLTCDTLAVVARRGRLGLLGMIVEQLDAMHNAALGRKAVTVTTAESMDDATRQQVRDELTKLLGAEPIMETTVDPSLIGGVVVRVGDKVFDASVRGRLERLSKDLIRRVLAATETNNESEAQGA